MISQNETIDEKARKLADLWDFFRVQKEAVRLGRLSEDGDWTKNIAAQMLFDAVGSEGPDVAFWFRYGYESKEAKVS